MKHLDLFSGIGGFALACRWVGIETIGFVEIDKFCQKVLKKNFPNVPIVENINNVEEIKVIADSNDGQGRSGNESKPIQTAYSKSLPNNSIILTAGFPCQPFSNAGKKRGSSDDRYLWPQTLTVIESVKPDWIILENVPGILNMVFPDSKVGVASQTSLFGGEDEIADYDTISGRIESDLRQAGYETVWMVIPACSLQAPHRRDRVWVVGNATSNTSNTVREIRQRASAISRRSNSTTKWVVANTSDNGFDRNDKRSGMERQFTKNQEQSRDRWSGRDKGCNSHASDKTGFTPNTECKGKSEEGGQIRCQDGEVLSEDRKRLWDGFDTEDSHASDTSEQRLQRKQSSKSLRLPRQCDREWSNEKPNWNTNWYEVATKFCRVDDGFPRVVDRVSRLKALGNAIVPQIAYQLIKTIKEVDSKPLNLILKRG